MIEEYLVRVGVVLIICRSSISDKLLKSWMSQGIQNFLSCPMCTGFWIGVIISPPNVYDTFSTGVMTSLISYIVVSATDALHSYMDHNERISRQWDVDVVEEERLD